jgi:hypothetical protein
MIPLDSARWSELTCTRGPATRVPDLLRTVYANPHAYERDTELDEVWSDLWDLLCHQGTINSTSFAAVPHLVEAGLKASHGILAFNIILLPIEIERSRLEGDVSKTIQPPEKIDPGYFEALFRLEDVCTKVREWGTNAELSKVMRMARSFFSKRRGSKLPKQNDDLGPLFGP